MRFKLLSTLAAVALLAACETAPQQTAATGGTGAAPAAPAAAPAAAGIRPGSQEDLVQNVGDRVFFDYDKSELRPEARRTIERWAAWMRQHGNVTITIEGHADERGTREYNIALGERRATAARNFLVSQGIDARRVATISYGKERPAVLGSNEGAWRQNRRGVAVVN
ncbi:MAG: peptidoglycan-associated lipoprotein Pal [Azospirillum sp.]|jgi:peptidoglycan-associated lipoprotein|nr:peptidoglycan-associated lipoprotein Pal [Azospirillum sp.]MCA3267604.1 peptidoglycan-associated lipoprotein Pal [Azospirillum sp.]MCZ8122569.1 peptidoglycan-associated lipoprotein Pal [Magnetospirillum sp.]